MKQIRLHTLLFISSCFLFSCSTETAEESNTEKIENTDSTQALITIDSSEDIVLNPNFDLLLSNFEANNKVEDSAALYMGINTKYLMLGLQYDNLWQFENNYLFTFWDIGGATDEHSYKEHWICYFDKDGDLLFKDHFQTTDDNVYEEIVQNQYYVLKNEYIETSWSGEDGEKSNNEKLPQIDIRVYRFSDDQMIPIDELEPFDYPFYRNEIYARRGLIFKTEKYQKHFLQFEWYEPKFENVDDKLSEGERLIASEFLRLEK